MGLLAWISHNGCNIISEIVRTRNAQRFSWRRRHENRSPQCNAWSPPL